MREWPQAETAGQQVQSASQFVYGVFALLTVVTIWWVRPLGRSSQLGWAVSVAFAGGLAPTVWGGASPLIGLLAGAASWIVAVVILRMLRFGLMPPSSVSDAGARGESA